MKVCGSDASDKDAQTRSDQQEVKLPPYPTKRKIVAADLGPHQGKYEPFDNQKIE